ncbi:MAG TPA: DNA-processing protein DprA [Thermoanaerobaculia bacterium]|nr:DNA-processing protein DprA [Thermoanaerobaculia bacterium]
MQPENDMAQLALGYEEDQAPARSVSPLLELGAYEALWLEPGATFPRLAERFRQQPGALPSDLVRTEVALETAHRAVAEMKEAGVGRFGVRIHGASEYPAKLRDARNPVELLYYQGWWTLVESPCVAVVGTRQPSEEGKKRARLLAKRLVAEDWTVVSGLAAGIDTAAHRSALDSGGRTIAVLGTPLTHVYPSENAHLQFEIAENFLVVSQVPVLRYLGQTWREHRGYFPERNATMSALTEATIIVEASDTSGTLYQARAALQQGRKLFILESCFHVPGLTWPERFERQGARRARDFDDIRKVLGTPHKD